LRTEDSLKEKKFLAYWNTLTESMGADQAASKKWGDILMKKYQGEERFFHNLDHVLDLLGKIESMQIDPHEKDTLKLVAITHDAEIIPGSSFGYNEKATMALQKKMCSDLKLDPVRKKDLPDYTEATITHDEVTKFSAGKNASINLFLDLDMSSLANRNIPGRPTALENVIREASLGSTREKGEAIVLEYIISVKEKAEKRGSFFITGKLDHLEKAAMDNLNAEIDLLKNITGKNCQTKVINMNTSPVSSSERTIPQ
jgi:predicted metal-dependent HD superfamily phosphohydrolase